MAVVKGPALSIVASGNLGAICYSKWGELQIARDVWTGTVPNTTKQIAQQQLIKDCAQYWGGTLTDGQRESWRELAREITFRNRFGEPVHYSGYVLFMSRNVNRLRWGYAIMDLPIAVGPYMKWSTIIIRSEASGYQIRFQATGYSSGLAPDLLEAWIAGPYDSGGRQPIEPEFKIVGYDKVSPLVVFKTALSVGKYYHCRMRLGDKAGVTSSWESRHVLAV